MLSTQERARGLHARHSCAGVGRGGEGNYASNVRLLDDTLHQYTEFAMSYARRFLSAHTLRALARGHGIYDLSSRRMSGCVCSWTTKNPFGSMLGCGLRCVTGPWSGSRWMVTGKGRSSSSAAIEDATISCKLKTQLLVIPQWLLPAAGIHRSTNLWASHC
jgi:hypothetical protein